MRGDKFDIDLWGEMVDDPRWSYDGMLPFMKKSEEFWSDTINIHEHGLDGLVAIQSESSTNRTYPMRAQVHSSWNALGLEDLPELDANAGESVGVAQLQENRQDGRREIAAARYSLANVTVLLNTTVEKVLVEKTSKGLSAVGIKLENGTEIRGQEVILSAGAIRSPQILMLSGIGPTNELKKFNIPVLLDQPAVGTNLADHGLFSHQWKLKDPAAGWCPGSGTDHPARSPPLLVVLP